MIDLIGKSREGGDNNITYRYVTIKLHVYTKTRVVFPINMKRQLIYCWQDY